MKAKVTFFWDNEDNLDEILEDAKDGIGFEFGEDAAQTVKVEEANMEESEQQANEAVNEPTGDAPEPEDRNEGPAGQDPDTLPQASPEERGEDADAEPSDPQPAGVGDDGEPGEQSGDATSPSEPEQSDAS